MEGFVLDAEHDREGNIILWIDGKEYMYRGFEPYFYVLEPEAEEKLRQYAKRIERTERGLKVYVGRPADVEKVKEIAESMGFSPREHSIDHVKKFFLDKGLVPLKMYRWEVEGNEIKGWEETQGEIELKVAAFDIETLAEGRMPDPKRDPVIMISYVDWEKEILFTTREGVEGDYVVKCETEGEMIRRFVETVRERDPDVLMGYNSDNFDIPYLRERARALGIKLALGRDGSEPRIRRRENRSVADIRGRQHVDVYRMITFLDAIGSVSVSKYDLETVYREVLGKEKIKIEHRDIAKEWREDGSRLGLYCLQDARACREIGTAFLDLYIMLSRLTLLTLYESVRASASQLVENYLIRKAREMGKEIPRKPKDEEVRKRLVPYQGGYVKAPEPGLHENIVVCDFRSLYPSIIISHNVDPETLDPNGEIVAPNGVRFRKEPMGLIPSMLREILTKRFALKKKLKEMPEGREKRIVNAEQWALKIVANATYGYMGYPRSRWYCRECAEAITAWGRKYIQWVMEEAEKQGFRVLYGDTDSVFLKLNGKKREDVEKFVEEINRRLPEFMELEIEGFYPRGIFITKRGEEKAAKKKYALIDEKGRLKIRGFEYVRRDWAEIARETQRRVLEIVLGEGDPKKALKYVKKVVEDIRGRKVPLEKMVIYTEIQKPLDSYESRGPHVAAALKAMKRGIKVGVGSIIGYVITDRGGKISDRAEYYLFADSYDPEYYIKNQVLPAVLPILQALGYDERSVLLGSQKTLFEF